MKNPFRNALNKVKLLQMLAILLLVQACQQTSISDSMLKNTQTDNHGERLQGDEFYVSKQTAVLAARNFANKYQFQFSNLLNRKEVKHKERSYKTVKNVLVLGNEKIQLFI